MDEESDTDLSPGLAFLAIAFGMAVALVLLAATTALWTALTR